MSMPTPQTPDLIASPAKSRRDTVLDGDHRQAARAWMPKAADKVFLSLVGVLLIVVAAIFMFDMPRPGVGGLLILVSVILIILGMPVGISMIVTGCLGLYKFVGFAAIGVSFEEIPFATVASWSLSVIPLFVLMGAVMSEFNLTAKLFTAAEVWLGRLPGGLAVATNYAGAGMAAASGSSVAIAHTLGRISIPQMLKAGYHPSLATGSVAMAGTLGMLIPPSIVLVVYSGVSGTPVGPQLIAALVPGLSLAVIFGAVILVHARINPKLAPVSRTEASTWKEKLAVLPHAVPVILIMLVIVGGMLAGWFTPTEAGAVGALAALLIGGLFGGRNGWSDFFGKAGRAVKETVVGVAAIFLLLIGVHFLTRVLALSRLPQAVTEFVTNLDLSPVVFLLALAVILLVLGMFMDGLSIILLTVPVLLPVLNTLDIDLVWFGVFLVVMVEIGLVTPPVGILGYVVHRITKNPQVNQGLDIKIEDVFKGVLPFVFAALLFVVALIFVPDIVLWLPEISKVE